MLDKNKPGINSEAGINSEPEKHPSPAAKHGRKVGLLPEPCRGSGSLLPFGSAPRTSPVALLGYWHRDGLAVTFHLGSGAGTAAAVDMKSMFGAHALFLLQKGVKHTWTRPGAPSDIFPVLLGPRSMACHGGWAGPVPTPATQPVCVPRTRQRGPSQPRVV